MSVLCDIGCAWEIDYITKILLNPLFDQHGYACRFLKTAELLAYNETSEENLVLVFTSNLATFSEIKTLIERLKPKVVIHMSDEWGTKPEFVDLSQLTKLVLRQHWFPHVYESRKNIFPIPLGVMTKFPFDTLEIKPMLNRELIWSFIGTVNPPRQNMLDIFKKQLVNKACYVARGGVKIQDVAKIYNDSIFVPNERGANRLDCFRIYEATLAGAIPVVVGSKPELAETFIYDYEEDEKQTLSWVIANNWLEASEKCLVLLQDIPKLQEMQKTNLKWFWKRITLAQTRILYALNK